MISGKFKIDPGLKERLMKTEMFTIFKVETFRKVFYGEGDHEPGKEPGDIVIQMEEKEHAVFQRHGEDVLGSTHGCDIANSPFLIW